MTLETKLADLRTTVQSEKALHGTVERMVAALKDDGATWEQIGAALGVSKQVAHYRYGRVHEQGG